MKLAAREEFGIRYVEVQPADVDPMATYVLIHGLGGSLEHWTNVIAPLGKSARAIAIDVPGFGQSRTMSGSFDLDSCVERILTFCRKMNLRSSVLVSHSIGCVIAARLATLEPTLFSRVIFVSGTLIRASSITQRPQRIFREPRLGFFVSIVFAAGTIHLPKSLLRAIAESAALRRLTLWPFVAHPERMSPASLLETLSDSGSLAVVRILLTAGKIDYIKTISAIAQPVDLIWGANDHLINKEDIAQVRTLVDVQRERSIQDCGHWPWLENPDDLVNFLTSRSPDGS